MTGLFRLLTGSFASITSLTLALYLPQNGYVSRVNSLGGRACLLLELLTCPVSRGGQLFLLIFRKIVTYLALLLFNASVLSNAFLTTGAHLAWASKSAIMWPHNPLFCPGDAMTLQKHNKVHKNEKM